MLLRTPTNFPKRRESTSGEAPMQQNNRRANSALLRMRCCNLGAPLLTDKWQAEQIVRGSSEMTPPSTEKPKLPGRSTR
jgi:hypothetical protein